MLEGFNVFISQQGTSPVTTGLNTTPTGALLNNGVRSGPGNMETAILTFQPSQLTGAWPVPSSRAIAPTQLALQFADKREPEQQSLPDPGGESQLAQPYAPAWNLSLQHAFTNNLSLQVAYVGSHGVGLLGLNDATLRAWLRMGDL